MFVACENIDGMRDFYALKGEGKETEKLCIYYAGVGVNQYADPTMLAKYSDDFDSRFDFDKSRTYGHLR